MKEQRWQDWSVIVLGTWLVFSPFAGIGAANDAAAINSYLIGAAVLVFAFTALISPAIWQEYTNLLLGFWLIIAPFTLGFTTQLGPMWNQIFVGLLIGGAALAVILQKSAESHGPEGHGHGHGHV